jgi:hypothetical protein
MVWDALPEVASAEPPTLNVKDLPIHILAFVFVAQ